MHPRQVRVNWDFLAGPLEGAQWGAHVQCDCAAMLAGVCACVFCACVFCACVCAYQTYRFIHGARAMVSVRHDGRDALAMGPVYVIVGVS